MLLLPLLAALGAALTQAAAAFIAHGAARQLGAVEFTRVQLTASALVLAVVVTATHGWSGLVATHMLAIGVSSIVGVVLTNLTMSECLRRSGPRRTQLLLTLRTPITAILAFAFLGEVLSLRLLLATSLILLVSCLPSSTAVGACLTIRWRASMALSPSWSCSAWLPPPARPSD